MKRSNRLFLSCAAVALILAVAWSWHGRSRRADPARRPAAAAPSLLAAKNALAGKRTQPIVPLLSAPSASSVPAAPVALSPIAVFNAWAEKYLAAAPEHSAGSLAAGEQLAPAPPQQKPHV